MSGVPGSKSGKNRRRNRGNRGRGRGRGSRSQSESTPGLPGEETSDINAHLPQQHVEQSLPQQNVNQPNQRQIERQPESANFASNTTIKEPEQEQAKQGQAECLSTQVEQIKTVPSPKSEPRPSSLPSCDGGSPHPAYTLQSSEASVAPKMPDKQFDTTSRPRGPTQSTHTSTISKDSRHQPGPKSKPTKHGQHLTITSSQPLRSDKAEPRPPRRPDSGGTLGRQIKLRVNFLPVRLPENDIHHYHTEIIAKGYESGKGYTKREAPMIIECMVDQYQKSNPHGPKLVYDKTGQNVYCKSPIPGIEKSREYTVLFTTDNDKQRECTVKIKWVSKVSLYDLNQALQGNRTEIPYDAMQAVEVVLRHLPNMTSIPVGASFFNHPDGSEKDLGFGVQVWNGTFVSIRPTQWKMMMLNVDTSSAVFYKAQSVLNFLCEFLNLRNPPRHLDKNQLEDFNDEIKDVKIQTTHVKRKQKVSCVSTQSAKNEIFDCDGAKISVFEYFKKNYDITLVYPDLPCLKLGQNASIPMELCNIMEGQRYRRNLTPDQLRAMIKHTALPAPERQQLIKDLVRNAKFDKNEFLADFGFQIGHDMARLTGRVLDPPMIAYGQSEKEFPRNGAWNMQHKSYKTVDLKEWAIVSYENPRFLNDAGLDKFVNSLVQAGKDKGLFIHTSPCFRSCMRGSEKIGRLLEDLHRRYPNLQLLIIILPSGGKLDAYYEAVKYYGDIIYGIRTQVIKANTACRKATDKQTMANICLKINAKLGGTTSVLEKNKRSEILGRPVIIFGADVTHPSPGDVNSPSIAAVVASMDSHPNQYSAEVRVQERRKEIITELKDIVKKLLNKFRTAVGVKPERIIFYRDGVSEGQFKDVLLHELRAIQLACYELHESFKPAITFIVVQKRHHTRFFAENPRDQSGKSKNIPPGTVVDTDVCHPYEFDWYLCSHAGIQGTSRPAHYHVLYDDSNFSSDQLQTLSNELCHTYVRCARAVSIPAPAYYAHHVAFRARYHLGELKRHRGKTTLSPQEMLAAVKIHERMTNTMYFA